MAFKRINFFKGFFTKAEDWQKAETYHSEKRKLHNRGLHTPGIVHGLEVETIKGGRAIHVGEGYAIDGQGRDLYLDEGMDIMFDGSKYESDKPIYMVAMYQEQATDERPVHGEKRNEFAFIEEGVDVVIVTDPPEGMSTIELARFVLAPGKATVRDPKDPDNPGTNEIDRRFVQMAGSVRGRISLKDIGTKVIDQQTSIVPTKDFTDELPYLLIKTVKETDSLPFFIVSAHPVGVDARISWDIEAVTENGKLEYRLRLKNFADKSVDVSYQVYEIY